MQSQGKFRLGLCRRSPYIPSMTGGLSATRWKAVRRLLHSRGREESGQLLVEGRRAVHTVCSGPLKPEFLLVGPALLPQWEQLALEIHSGDAPAYELTSAQVSEITDTAHPQELFAVLGWRPATALPSEWPGLMLHLSGIRNPQNMGALLRTAAAFDLCVTCSPDCVDVTHPAAVRGGAGCYFNLPLYVNVTLSDLRKKGRHQLVYASASAGIDPTMWKWPERTLLVLGGEAFGATESMEGATAVHIPIHVESLNAAVAGGIMMWEAHRGRKA